MELQPEGVVLLTKWLNKQGYSFDLIKMYKKYGWLRSIGRGVTIRSSQNPTLEGVIFALQNQLNLSIHPGGKTALALLGKSHFLELSASRVFLFGQQDEMLPSWFEKYDWPQKVFYQKSNFLPKDIGLQSYEHKNFSISISDSTRALLECIYLAPKKQELLECYQIMEGLNNLNPKQVQNLLEQCNSVKVNRVFLYLAQKAKHRWFDFINTDKIDLGKGKRSLVSDGVYIPEYKITVPKELANYDS